jgi:Sulfatase
MKARFILEGLGASLLLLSVFQVLVSDYPIHIHPLPVTNLIGGLLVGMVIVAVLIAAALFAVEKLNPTARRFLLAWFAGLMLWRFLDSFVTLVNAFASQLSHKIYFWDPIRNAIGVAILVVSLACAWFTPRIADRMIGYVRLLVAACAFAVVAILPHLVRAMTMRPPPQGVTAVNQDPSLPGAAGNRIVWILFDELSYDQTFDHPQPGIVLPAFDRLRNQSFNFSNIKPAGYYTEQIIPSLFLGQQIEIVRRTSDGQIFYKTKDNQQSREFDPRDTLFNTARAEGWSTGLVGWLIPYCRFMGSELDSCFWNRNDDSLLEPFGASEDKSMLANAGAIPVWTWANIIGDTHEYNAEHLANYQEIMRHAAQLIDDSRLRFLYIHLPIPHPPGIYDRRNNRLRAGGSYLDNLVLADQAAATLLSEIDTTPSASRTTLIVTSDHSFRIALWKNTKGAWTDEDQAATGGYFDDRPVLMVRFPGQTSGPSISASFDEMLEHDILEAMLRGRMKTPAEFAEFLKGRRIEFGAGAPTTSAQNK